MPECSKDAPESAATCALGAFAAEANRLMGPFGSVVSKGSPQTREGAGRRYFSAVTEFAARFINREEIFITISFRLQMRSTGNLGALTWTKRDPTVRLPGGVSRRVSAAGGNGNRKWT